MKFSVLFLTIIFSSILHAEILPVKTFFKYSDIDSIKISPDGKHYAARVTKEKSSSIVILDVKTKKLVHNQNFSKGDTNIGEYGWLNNERIYAHMVVKSGSLERPFGTGRYFAANIDGSHPMLLMERYGYNILNFLRNDPEHIIISKNKDSFTSGMYRKAFKKNVYSGRETSIVMSPKKYSSLLTDHQGNVKISFAFDINKDTVTIYFLDGKKKWHKFKKYDTDRVGIFPIAFNHDNSKLFVHVGDGIHKRGIYLLDLVSSEMELVMLNEGEFSIEDYIFDNNPNPQLVGFTTMPGKIVKHYFDAGDMFTKLSQQIDSLFPDQFVDFINFTEDGNQALLKISSDKNPATFYRFDLTTNKLEYLLRTNPWIKEEQMLSMQPIQFEARDGLKLHGYLTFPKGKTRNQPMVVMVHGGPFGLKDEWTFDPEVQFLANRGYLVLQINFRGSGGRGDNFEFDNYRKMGAEMQDDITDGTLWAIEKNYADKDKVCIYGASYGGYAAMMGVVKEPDLYRCAIAYAGVYDIAIQGKYSDTSDSDSGERFLEDAWNAYDKEFVRQRSPLFHLDKLNAAVMLVHGEDDERTPIHQYEALSDALDDMDYPYESIVKDDEGHGFYSEENKIELYTKMAKFLDKHLNPGT